MAKPLSPKMRQRLENALFAIDFKGPRHAAVERDLLVAFHGAKFRPGAATNSLSCAGVTATCTWSEDLGLVDAWVRKANARLLEASNG